MPQQKLETLYQGKHLKLVRRGQWEFADRTQGTGVVAVIAVTDKNELVLTEQYRAPVQKKVIDLPAGLAGDIADMEEEGFEVAARRELEEETGFTGSHFEFVFSGPPSPGMSAEVIDFYLVRDVSRIGQGGGDESEDIRVHVVDIKKIGKWLERKSTKRTCVDIKVYAALGVLNVFS